MATNLTIKLAGMSEIEQLEYLLRKARDRLPRMAALGENASVGLEMEMKNIASLEQKLEKARKRAAR